METHVLALKVGILLIQTKSSKCAGMVGEVAYGKPLTATGPTNTYHNRKATCDAGGAYEPQ
jgi:hypothetical protein